MLLARPRYSPHVPTGKNQRAVERWKNLKTNGAFQMLPDNKIIAEMNVSGSPEWMVSALFALYDGDLLPVEIRVFPAEHRAPPDWSEGTKSTQEAAERLMRIRGNRFSPDIGEWSRDVTGLDELRVHNGVTAGLLKKVKIGPLFDLVHSWSGFIAATSMAAPEVYTRMAATPNPGRHRRDDLHWAEWSRRIHEKTISSTRSPIADVARETGLERDQVRDIAHECRAHGFLGPSSMPRRGGGLMTDQAKSVLESALRGKRRPH